MIVFSYCNVMLTSFGGTPNVRIQNIFSELIQQLSKPIDQYLSQILFFQASSSAFKLSKEHRFKSVAHVKPRH